MKHASTLSALLVVACSSGSPPPASTSDMTPDATVPGTAGSSSSGSSSSGGSASGGSSGSPAGGSSGTSPSGSSSGGSSSGGSAGGSSSGGSSSGSSSSGSPGSDAGAGSSPDGGGEGGEGGASAGGAVNVLTNRYDNARTGSNPNETILTTSNVDATTFGFKFSAPVTGRIYGQPLYVSNLMVGGASHNVVYVATEHNMVYAFDADDGTQLWAATLEPPAILGGGDASYNPGCADMGSGATTYEVGITSTPVIDPVAGLMYVVAKTSGQQMIHALSLATGKDGPTPTAVGPAGFASDIHLNRPGLLLLNGTVYVAFGSHCDNGAYHGWIFGQDAKTLALTVTYNSTPTGTEGAIWQGGVGLSSDGTAIWFSVANGTSGAPNMGMNVVKATVSGSTLTNTLTHQEVADGDNDLSAGVVLVGDQVVSGGKSGNVIFLSAGDAGQITRPSAGGEVHNVATWNGGAAGQFIYTWGSGSQLHAWQVSGGTLVDKGTNTEQTPGHPGGMITISSNGTLAGTGVLWALIPTSGDAWHSTSPGALYAFDASDVTKPSLWNSGLDTTTFGTYAKFSPPTVANGKVYAATFSNQLNVYGLK
jgi:outer membrane protein assembly factor BamB